MSTGERFGLIISFLGLIFAVMTALLTYVVKGVAKWTRTDDKIVELISDVEALIIRKDKDHELIRADLEDRQKRGDAVHGEIRERLTYLERRELYQRRKEDA